MIPFIHLPTYHLGPLPLDPWGLLVTTGFVLGLEIARAQGIKKGLEVRDVVDGVVFTVLMGFVFGHLVHVLAYHPEKYERDGIASLYRIWEGFSSYGGFLGALIGNVLFYRVLRPRPWLAHADVVMYAFPFAWIFGRAGCAIVHDHIGRPTAFPLAVNFDPMLEGLGMRHDLGLYECLYSIVISAVFFTFRNRAWPAGSFLVLWTVLYAPVRFSLDFLRRTDEIPGFPTADVRWAGLTPGQWGSVTMLLLGVALFAHLRRKGALAVGDVIAGKAE